MTPGHKVVQAFKDRGYSIFAYRIGDADKVDDSEAAGIIESESGMIDLLRALTAIVDRSENAPPIHALRQIGEAILAAKVILKEWQ